MQTVARNQSFISIRTLHEFVAKTSAPARSKCRRLRQRLQMQLPPIVAANHHGKAIVEAKWTSDAQPEFFVTLLHASIHVELVTARLLLQHRSQRRSCVFGINVNAPGKNRLLANKCSRQIEAPLHRKVSLSFDDLSEQLSQNHLLGEILGANHNSIAAAFAAHHRQKKQESKQQADESFTDLHWQFRTHDFERSVASTNSTDR